jgi:hypothetical protein
MGLMFKRFLYFGLFSFVGIILYGTLGPYFYNLSIRNNYNKNKSQFIIIEKFLSDKKPINIKFTNRENFSIKIRDDKNKFQAEVVNGICSDSLTETKLKEIGWSFAQIEVLYNLLETVDCESLQFYDTYEFPQKPAYLLIYHQEFQFAPWAYFIGLENNVDDSHLDDFYKFEKINKNTGWGTLRWN